MAMEHELEWADYFVLDRIAQYGWLDDFTLSKALHCPRSFLLERLYRLVQQEYLVPTQHGYRLSDEGQACYIPLALYHAIPQKHSDPFDWTVPYVPAAGWQD